MKVLTIVLKMNAFLEQMLYVYSIYKAVMSNTAISFHWRYLPVIEGVDNLVHENTS